MGGDDNTTTRTRTSETPIAVVDTTTKRFGSTLRAITHGAPVLLLDGTHAAMREALEPYFAQARDRRNRAVTSFHEECAVVMQQQEDNGDDTDTHLITTLLQPLTHPVVFAYDTSRYDLRGALLQACRLSPETDLTQLHTATDEDGRSEAKYNMLQALTENYSEFQATFLHFILQVCAPRMPTTTSDDDDDMYIQAFPCLRVIQPGEFSIGPHCDMCYGHHPASVNFYLPLTPISGTASLYLESTMGQEDWHPLPAHTYGTVQQFHGATCLHWTAENTTACTRVSLDVRLIPGHLFRSLRWSGDARLREEGYYCRCVRMRSGGTWVLLREQHEGEEDPCVVALPRPDARMGFPWTVKDWTKWRDQQQKKRTARSKQTV